MSERLARLEREVNDLRRILPLTEAILGELLRSAPVPTRLEPLERFLAEARQLMAVGEPDVAEQLFTQIEAALADLRQWLAVADLGISPYVLRTYLERHPLDPDTEQALIRYFLDKQPHVETDRDKLDYLLSSHCALTSETRIEPRFPTRAELATALAAYFSRPAPELPPSAEIMLHEMESLGARVDDFTDFNLMVGARMVERVRALKINLREHFYHPQALTTIVSFNLAFRRRFEQLFRAQIEQVRQQTRALLEAARGLLPAIEAAFQALPTPGGARLGAGLLGAAEAASPALGRPLEVTDERLPLDHLVHPPSDADKEKELAGLLKRIARFLATLSPQEAARDRVLFPLRHTQLELYEWEREAFATSDLADGPVAARTIQLSLALVALMEEEHTFYQENRDDRYQWKPHFDLLSYAIERARDLLTAIHRMLTAGSSAAAEQAWFPALVNTAQRLAQMLDRLAPVFA